MKYITTEFKKFVRENLHAQIKENKEIDSDSANKSVEPLLNNLVKEVEKSWQLKYREEFENIFNGK